MSSLDFLAMTEGQRPIGVFDSGVGGLTVVRTLREVLPQEDIVYFGDTARVPYGTKSVETIRRYTQEDVRFLLQFRPKLIVIACNTVSALAADVAKETAGEIPVLGVLHAGASLAVARSREGKVGVIGTEATIHSGAYSMAISQLSSTIKVTSIACPLFVPLAEEGFALHPATELIAKEYLEPLMNGTIDTLVLGCTHYPILKPMIERVLHAEAMTMSIIDSAEAVAHDVETYLQEHKLMRESQSIEGASGRKRGEIQCFVSDLPKKFLSVAQRFLGEPALHAHLIRLSEHESVNTGSRPSTETRP